MIGLAVGLAAQRFLSGSRRVVPIMGLLAAGATMAGMAQAGRPLPAGGSAGLGLLAVAGLVPTRAPAGTVGRAALLLAGAVLTGGLAFAVPLVAGPGLDDLDRRWQRRAYGPLFLGVSVFGVFATVPDTERLFVLIGATFPLLVLAWPVPRASVGTSGCYAMAGLLVAIAMLDGAGRTSSVVGSMGCVLLLGVEPVARRLRDGRTPLTLVHRRLPRPLAAVVVSLVFAALVAFASRVAGFAGVGPAVAMVVGELALAVGVLATVVDDRRSATTGDTTDA